MVERASHQARRPCKTTIRLPASVRPDGQAVAKVAHARATSMSADLSRAPTTELAMTQPHHYLPCTTTPAHVPLDLSTHRTTRIVPSMWTSARRRLVQMEPLAQNLTTREQFHSTPTAAHVRPASQMASVVIQTSSASTAPSAL